LRNPALIAIAILCSFATGCPTHNDTAPRKEWPRFVEEPSDLPVRGTECGTITSRAHAVRLFPVCMDKAIAALQGVAERDNIAMGDLAVAYYKRAKQRDMPADYLNAYDAAQRAMNALPRPPYAKENLTKIEHALGFDAKIEREVFQPDNLKSVARYPASALHYLETELLPERTQEARRIATQIVQITHDRYPLDEVEACAAAAGPVLKSAYASYRAADFKTAAAQLRSVNNPLSLYAETREARPAKDFRALDRLEEEARRRGYLDLQALILSTRGYLTLFEESDYLASNDNYEKALRLYQQLNDSEHIASTQTRLLGNLRVTGQLDQAWREALTASRKVHKVASLRERNLLLGEIAAVANVLDHPRAAFQYADMAVRLIEQSAATPRERAYNLGIAMRRRATYELRIDGMLAEAQADLNKAIEYATSKEDAQDRRSLEARNAEVEAQLAMRVRPVEAIDSFTRALALSDGLEYRSFRASLYAQRAAAKRAAGRPDDAEQDLRKALHELNAEESNLLAKRDERSYERILWNEYFSRFQTTYHELIRHLIVDKDRGDEAFKYADRARAFEPLNLTLKLTSTAASPIDMAHLQKLLPYGTFLVEYTVLDDITFAWVITHDRRQVVRLKTGRAKIRRWSSDLQAAVKVRDLDAIDRVLLAAYDELLTGPRAVIEQMPGSSAPRLVIIPDGTMEAIPFAALRNPVSRRYLIRDTSVSTAGSAALYALSVKRDRELKRDGSALLFGLLPHAEHEVQKIAKQYEPNAVVRIGAAATADEFLARAGQSAIVHFGGHAIVDTGAPSRSKLVFASSELDATQLLARFKPVRTRLVVLGACSSAGGLPLGPEGVAPLVRPLIARGVPAVIGTLWDVDDATAEELLVSFHQHYRKGNDAATAMRLAQLELLGNNNDVLRSVLAWAPYQVIGQGSSPFPAPRH